MIDQDPVLVLFIMVTFFTAGIVSMGLGALLSSLIRKFRRGHDEL
jgi:hypothetical protein